MWCGVVWCGARCVPDECGACVVVSGVGCVCVGYTVMCAGVVCGVYAIMCAGVVWCVVVSAECGVVWCVRW